MARLIDKDCILAEIEKQQRRLCILGQSNEVELRKNVAIQNGVYCSLLSFLDNLEVKEVQEEPVDKCKGCNNVKGCITCVDGDQWAHYEEPVSEDLEKAAKDYGIRQGVELKPFAIKYFKAGAKWKEQQMMSKAIDGKLYSTFCGSEQNVVDYVSYSEYGKRLK